MPEDRESKSGLEQASSAAQFVKGAVKTGKSIAAASKGAAAGPYGAAAGFLIENRKTAAKAVCIAAILLAIPVFFLMMLPSMIFGNLFDSAPNDVLNNMEKIEQNMSDTEATALNILTERHSAVLLEIQSEIDSHGTNCVHSITDPYAESIFLDTNNIISWYSASNKDVKEINLTNFRLLLESHKQNLYSYSVETWEEEEYDEENDTYDTITHYDYTVEYVGDDYFPATVFSLDDEQLKLAVEYLTNLNTFLAEQYDVATNGTHDAIQEVLQSYDFTHTGGTFGQPLRDVEWRSCITSDFAEARPNFNDVHTGLDMSPESEAGRPIQSVMDGIVIFVRKSTSKSGYGYHVAVYHGNGIVTMYAHCSSIIVSEGQEVSKGQQIAAMGTTGKSSGPHLHLEVIVDGEIKDPKKYLP